MKALRDDDFNPRSQGGSDIGTVSGYDVYGISIHAPKGGATKPIALR